MTEYYCFAFPITSIKPEKVGEHIHLRVFVRNALSGTLILRENETKELLARLHEPQPAVVRTFEGGKNVYSWKGSFADDVYLIDEYGEICQAKDLK